MNVAAYWPNNLFDGRTLFVTGGGSGINLGIGLAFASLGANVGVCGRDAAKLEEACHQLSRHGSQVYTAVADVRDSQAVARVIEECGRRLGPISVLVCGAAVDFPFPAAQMSPESFQKVVETDLSGSFYAARAAFGQLKETRGLVLFISGPQAWLPAMYQCHVGAAKAGVDNLTRNLALEWGPYGIRCNSISPGPIENTAGFDQLNRPENYERLKSLIPLGRYGAIEDVASAAVFLASPLANYITGVVISVDGGHSLPGMGVHQAVMGGLI